MTVRTVGTAPGQPQDFSHLQSLNDSDAGDEIASYIARNGGDDIDLFDQDRAPRRAASPGEDDTETLAQNDTEDEEARRAAQRKDEDDAEAEAKAKADAEASDDDDPDDAGPELEAATLAALLGVDENALVVLDDGSVALTTTVDGETGQATLAELVKGYQTEANVTRRSQEVARQREQLEQQFNAKQAELSQVMNHTLAMGKAMHDRMVGKYEGVDWQRLRVENPGEFAALQQQMNMESASIQQETQMLVQQMEQQRLGNEREQAERRAAWIVEQQAALFQHMPEMATPETRAPLLNEYHEYLSSYGFADEEVQGILDHRMLRVINDAVLHQRALKQKDSDGEGNPKPPLAKRLKNVPRVRKPGAATSERTNTRERAQAAQRRLAKSGTDRDAAIAMIESGVVDNLL